jgi:ATPase subunit of ABC transporter with duplicated ATPase domains
MPATPPAFSISLSHLTWSAPDGQRVVDDLTLDFGRERTGLVGRNGVGKSTLLKLVAGQLIPAKGTVTVHGSIAAMRQIVQIEPGETLADLLGVAGDLALLRRAEAGTATLDELDAADWSLGARVEEALAQMGLAAPPETPLAHLSGGQRTRAALAGMLLARPDFMLLDEPTNDLDRDGRRAVIQMLRGWRAGAVVVSHDRELLEEMDAIVELTKLGAARFGGNWSHYRERKAIELAGARHDLAVAERARSEAARKAQVTAERQQRRDAAGSRNAARGGMPRILMGARRERAQNSGAGNVRLAERQRGEVDRAVEQARERIERTPPLAIAVASTGLAPSQRLLTLEHVTAGYGGAPVLRDVSLTMVGPERVAIIGANGSGKSTLLRVVAGELAPLAGRATRHVAFAMLDQRVSLLDRAATLAENFGRINPGVSGNACRAALARFGFRAGGGDRLAATLSGGQMLRAALACALGNPAPPPLLILDEPTNYLDIDTVAALEAALAAYDGGLLVVSHDARFLQNIGVTREIAL